MPRAGHGFQGLIRVSIARAPVNVIVCHLAYDTLSKPRPARTEIRKPLRCGPPAMMQKKSSAMLKVALQRKSPISPEGQLIAHLKIAMMLGDLKPGEQLPSVRQLETRLGVGRNVVWRAYSKLAETGAITIESRRRATINTTNQPEKAAELVQVFDWLAKDVIQRLQALRINPQSFQRFLSHRIQQLDLLARDVVFVECNHLQAQLWSGEISELWDLHVPGLEIRALRALPAEERSRFKTVLTPLYHHEEVQALFQNPNTNVVALRLQWDRGKIREWRSLPSRSRIAIVLEKSECLGYGDPFAHGLGALCPNVRIEVIPFKSSAQVKALLASGKYAHALLSGAVLESVDEKVRGSPRIARHALGIDRRSLEEARIRAGVVL